MARRPAAPVRIGANLAGLVIFAACAFPVYWMVNTSLLPRREIRAPEPTWAPLGGTLDNYRRVLEGGRFFDALGMSLAVTVGTVLVSLVFAFLAALAVSRFRFRGRKSFIVSLLLIQMIPVEGLFISQYKMLEGFHLLNTVAGLTLVYVANVLPFTVWTLRGFVAGRALRARGGRDDGRLLAVPGVPQDHLPAARARPGRHRRLRLHPGVERVHARGGRDDARRQEDAAASGWPASSTSTGASTGAP